MHKTKMSSMDFKSDCNRLLSKISDTTPRNKLNISHHFMKDVYSMIPMRIQEKIIEVCKNNINNVVQSPDIEPRVCLSYLNAFNSKFIISVSEYQRQHRNLEFLKTCYLQILVKLLRLEYDRNIIDEMVELYNENDTTIKEKMCIADSIRTHDQTIGDRMLEEIRRLETVNFSLHKTVYSDTQNVHNHFINKSVNDAAKYLCENWNAPLDLYNYVESHISVNDNIRESLSRIQYDQSIMNSYTMNNIFGSIIGYIIEHPNKKEMWIRVGEELNDMSGYCATGHFSRIINIIQGFDGVPDILLIKISILDELIAVFSLYMKNILSKDEDLMDLMLDDREGFMEKLNNFSLKFIEDYVKLNYKITDDEISNYMKTVLKKYYP
jgi:hypothetical protein